MTHSSGILHHGTTPLMERDYQLRVIDVAISSCKEGNGGLLLVEGNFGTGKTSLLKAVQQRAVDDGCTVLHARGNELEKTFPYGVVRQLFEPCLAAASPEERGALLSGPAALAAPLFDHHRPVALDDLFTHQRQAILHGLHRMLVTLSRHGAVLLLDDLHWADEASLRFLHHIQSHPERHPVLCVATTASVDLGGNSDLIHALLTSPAVRTIPVDVLSEGAVREILRSALGHEPDAPLVRACHRTTGGHPYFLRELISELTYTQTPGSPWEPGVVTRVGPRNVARVVHGWIHQVAGEHLEATQHLAHALAVMGGCAGYDALADVTRLTGRELTDAAGVLTDIDVLEPGTPLRYRHPIVHNAVYEHMPRSSRYRTHSDVAQALARSDAPPEEVAAHLLRVPPTPDDRTMRVLITAGRRAVRRSDPALAVTLLSGALERTTDPASRAAIALRLSDALGASVRDDEVLRLFQDGHVEVGGRSGEQARRPRSDIVRMSERFPATRPAEGDALSGAGPLRTPGGADGALSLPRARRAFKALLQGSPATEVGKLAEEALLEGPPVGELDGGAETPWLIAFCFSCCGRLPEATALLDASLRRPGTPGLRRADRELRALRAFVQLHRGMLAEAEADATAVLDDTPPGNLPGLARSFAVHSLVEVLLLRNRTRAAAHAFERHGMPGGVPQQAPFLPLMAARGRLRIALGNAETGALDLLRAHELLSERGARCTAFHPSVGAVDALTTLGRTEEARSLAEEQLVAARAFGEPRVIACALAAYARMVDGDASLGMLTEAVELLETTHAVVSTCATLVQLGTALRAAGRTAQARRRLRAADDIAGSAGIASLGKQARKELSAMGVRVRHAARTGVAGLTPREHHVSLLAAEGKRNQEIARILFVTVKTVEWHLSQAYRKLGIASRWELRQALARGRAASAPALRGGYPRAGGQAPAGRPGPR